MDIQKLKFQAELARVQAARLEMEIKVIELSAALERLGSDIANQKKRESELEGKIKNIES